MKKHREILAEALETVINQLTHEQLVDHVKSLMATHAIKPHNLGEPTSDKRDDVEPERPLVNVRLDNIDSTLDDNLYAVSKLEQRVDGFEKDIQAHVDGRRVYLQEIRGRLGMLEDSALDDSQVQEIRGRLGMLEDWQNDDEVDKVRTDLTTKIDYVDKRVSGLVDHVNLEKRTPDLIDALRQDLNDSINALQQDNKKVWKAIWAHWKLLAPLLAKKAPSIKKQASANAERAKKRVRAGSKKANLGKELELRLREYPTRSSFEVKK